uniref:Uncharacterized protein n=1 Tax=Helianthus annuus TaxID=4232 RepID=A0A251RYL4_HELAN
MGCILHIKHITCVLYPLHLILWIINLTFTNNLRFKQYLFQKDFLGQPLTTNS